MQSDGDLVERGYLRHGKHLSGPGCLVATVASEQPAIDCRRENPRRLLVGQRQLPAHNGRGTLVRGWLKAERPQCGRSARAVAETTRHSAEIGLPQRPAP